MRLKLKNAEGEHEYVGISITDLEEMMLRAKSITWLYLFNVATTQYELVDVWIPEERDIV